MGYLVLRIAGLAFVLHQIRHIVGASLAVAHGVVPADAIRIALRSPLQVDLPGYTHPSPLPRPLTPATPPHNPRPATHMHMQHNPLHPASALAPSPRPSARSCGWTPTNPLASISHIHRHRHHQLPSP